MLQPVDGKLGYPHDSTRHAALKCNPYTLKSTPYIYKEGDKYLGATAYYVFRPYFSMLRRQLMLFLGFGIEAMTFYAAT